MPTAIITGGAVRIGQAFALSLAHRGYDLAIHHNTSSPTATMNYAEQAGVQCKAYPCDLSDMSAVERMIGQMISECDDVSLLINCAANFIQENVEATTNATLLETLQINLMSPYVLMREFKKQVGKGMIVNILDERIEKNIPTFAAYSVSKVALAHLTKLAALEWGRTVRVNGIAPGLILPPPGHGDDYLTKNAPNIPTGEHGYVEDLTRALDYLIDSPFVNGEVLFVDGGESAR